MKVTVKAPANIAFIKYWGKRDKKLRIPVNGSISMNLFNVFTTTTVELFDGLRTDKVTIDGEKVQDIKKERVVTHLDRVRKLAGLEMNAVVQSKNNFPKGAGIASSASGFAALTLAASKAFGLNLSEKQLSILARLGSGSACRSIPNGFVEWKAGGRSDNSYAHSLYPANYWNIVDIVVIVDTREKKVGSTKGHVLAENSPFFKPRVNGIRNKLINIKSALKKRNFTRFGQIVEEEAINMHAVMMTSTPPLFYWSEGTLTLIKAIQKWRKTGIESYFTIDAGPNVHIICKEHDAGKIISRVKRLGVAESIIKNKPANGAGVV